MILQLIVILLKQFPCGNLRMSSVTNQMAWGDFRCVTATALSLLLGQLFCLKAVILLWHDLCSASLDWLFLIALLCSKSLEINSFPSCVLLSIAVGIPGCNTVKMLCSSFSSHFGSPLLCSLLVAKQSLMELAQMEYWKTNYMFILVSFSLEYLQLLEV